LQAFQLFPVHGTHLGSLYKKSSRSVSRVLFLI
jgi:hypothetical protein